MNNCGHCGALKFEYEPPEQVQPGQRPQDRLDLILRGFRAELQDLKDQLFKKEIFGKVAAHFDKFICAELLDKKRFPKLFDLVVKHMMHGPCGETNKRNSCMVKRV
ncbi:hypothetical protein M9H77_06363 [Catharanthus roseus]|uniref:Uncharacterized protein n=1 Tax=Catharanthus roseus TaxID=4058 RepID=A0ACC0BRW9_CATRO|nr:hypothetical protein M9H77_06363 [Catharanthus roseus]